MPSCIFCGRSQFAKLKNNGITFHKFPKDNATLAVWMEFAKQCSANVKCRSLVCSVHFTQDCFEHFLKSVHLKKFSVPTIMIQRVKNAKSIYPEILTLSNLKDQECTSNEQHIKVTVDEMCVDEFKLITNVDINANISTKNKDYYNFEFNKPDKKQLREHNAAEIYQPTTNSMDSSERLMLEKQIYCYSQKINLKNKKIKYLKQKIERQHTEILTLKCTNQKLKDNADLLSKCSIITKRSTDSINETNILHNNGVEHKFNNQQKYYLQDHDYI